MNLIIISLSILLVITFFNVVLGATMTDISYTAEGGYGVSVGIDAITGALAVIIVLIAIAVLVGIQVLGSGISEQSVKTIIIITGYASLWGIFSVLSINLIISIEIFGYIIYIGLTIIYAIGVMNKLSE
ncbi:MAG: hypothetical protein ACFFAO_02180 [Candidatus Hermodarchaeota archaeon]